MKTIALIVFTIIVSACGSINQQNPMIAIPTTPRMIIKEIPVDGKRTKGQVEAREELFSRPDLTRGYIENQSFPYVPRVWLLNGNKKVLLVGQTKTGPPRVLDWQILEFSFPPGFNQVVVEWWEYVPYNGQWRQIKSDIKGFQVAVPRRGYWSGYGNSHYNWAIVIRPGQILTYEGGQCPSYGHGRYQGW